MNKNNNKNVVLYSLTRFLICIFILYLSINYGRSTMTFQTSEPMPAGFAIVVLYAICIILLDSCFLESLINVTSHFIIIILDVLATFVILKWSIVVSACIMIIFCVFELCFINCHESEQIETSNDEIENIEE